MEYLVFCVKNHEQIQTVQAITYISFHFVGSYTIHGFNVPDSKCILLTPAMRDKIFRTFFH